MCSDILELSLRSVAQALAQKRLSKESVTKVAYECCVEECLEVLVERLVRSSEASLKALLRWTTWLEFTKCTFAWEWPAFAFVFVAAIRFGCGLIGDQMEPTIFGGPLTNDKPIMAWANHQGEHAQRPCLNRQTVSAWKPGAWDLRVSLSPCSTSLAL